MKLNSIKNTDKTRIYVAPANPAGRQLMTELNSQETNVIGFIDNIKVGVGIFKPSQIDSDDKVIVAYGGFQSLVAEQLIKNGLNINQVNIVSANGIIQDYSRRYKVMLRNIATTIFISFIKLLRLIPYRHRRVYYAESFVDANVLITYNCDIENVA